MFGLADGGSSQESLKCAGQERTPAGLESAHAIARGPAWLRTVPPNLLDCDVPAHKADPMANVAMLDEFARTGVMLLHDVFSNEDAEAMRQVVWQDLYHTDGVRRDDASTWHRSIPRRALHHAKRHPIFHKMVGPLLRDVADALLGPGWTTSGAFGNLLVDFRDAERWRLPGRDGHWHLDTGWEGRMARLSNLRIFGLFGDVPPGGGGTLLVAGSPHFVRRHVATEPQTDRRGLKAGEAAALLFQSDPWLAELTLADPPAQPDPAYEAERRRRFVETPTDVDGTPAQVIEACGRAGDVYVCHPWTIHCRPPIASDGPRFIRSPTLFANLD